ncbi:MAG: class II SORL domain-containing protein [Synergistaceae bacterium]|nr:class II SORL domain-containing protein [Synergistaceae bacterium]
MKLGELIQSGDFKGEKHVPVIEAPSTVKAGEAFMVNVSVGKEIPHPNKPEHHICWIQLLYKPAGGKFAIELAKFDYTAHAASMDPAVPGPAMTEPASTVLVKLAKSGTLIVQSYCNIHGLWESSEEIEVQ